MSLNYKNRRFSRKNENIRSSRKNSKPSRISPRRLKESVEDDHTLEELMENPNLMKQFCKEHNLNYSFGYYLDRGENVPSKILNNIYNRVSENNDFDWVHDPNYDGWGDDDSYFDIVNEYEVDPFIIKLRHLLMDTYEQYIKSDGLLDVCWDFIEMDIDLEEMIRDSLGYISASLDLSKLDKNDPNVQNFLEKFIDLEDYEDLNDIDWEEDVCFRVSDIPSVMKKRGWVIESRSKKPFKIELPFNALSDVTFIDSADNNFLYACPLSGKE